ncbi:FAD-binding oxidoreductase [Actinoallomurus acaciae]|uniref:FAD-binding oxidoreductase n=1 Tax=Actinoallomurus acaciae TaxID=502577 RepID=A0ABV5YLY3_9ACTN
MATRDIRQVLVERGDPGYEKARTSMAANECAPSRRPDVIVQAACAEEVREAVALARAHGMQVTVRAGEDGLGGAPLRDGGMLIDLSRLRGCSVENGTATVQPGVSCQDLTRALADRDHAFPAAHRGSVALSGFVLGGGIGWNSRAWGPACASVEAIEVVTATGEIVQCSDHENSGLLWAARGGGPGFFAAVTSFRLRLRHLPPAIMTTRYVFPLADIEDVAYWSDEIAAAIPANVELSVALTTADGGLPKVAVVTATVFSCAWNDAIRCLEPLRACPFAGRALIRQVDQPTPFAVLFTGSDALWPCGRRTAADSLWLNGGFSALLPMIARHVENAPSSESIVVAEPAPGGPAHAPVPEMAFSPLGRIRLGCYAMWEDPSDDGANLAWLRELAAAAEPQAAGRYVAETDLAAEPQRARRSFTPSAWERFQDLRARYDPDGVFETYPQP